MTFRTFCAATLAFAALAAPAAALPAQEILIDFEHFGSPPFEFHQGGSSIDNALMSWSAGTLGTVTLNDCVSRPSGCGDGNGITYSLRLLDYPASTLYVVSESATTIFPSMASDDPQTLTLALSLEGERLYDPQYRHFGSGTFSDFYMDIHTSTSTNHLDDDLRTTGSISLEYNAQLEAVPLPPAGLLLAGALAGAAGLRLRRG